MTARETRSRLQREAAEAAARLPDLLTEAEHAAQVVTAGRHPRQREGRSDTFWQFRDYAHGDPVSAIDWRQSARLERRLLVRQTEWEQPQTVLVWCGGGDDFDYASRGLPPKRRRGQVLTLAMMILALRSGERVGIWGSEEPPKAGQHALDDLSLRLLSTDADLRLAGLREGAVVLLVSDFHDDPDALHAAFARIRSARGKPLAVVVEDPAEETFPFEGSLRFESPAGLRRRNFGEARAVREAYLSARAAHHDELRAAARGHGEAVFFHRTDQPVTPVLLQLSDRISGDRR